MEDDGYDGRINEISLYIGVIIESYNKMRKVERTSTSIGFFFFFNFASNGDDSAWEARGVQGCL